MPNSSRLGLGEGKHLLNHKMRQSADFQQNRIQRLGLPSVGSQASINSLKPEFDWKSPTSFLGSGGTDLPHPYDFTGRTPSPILYDGYIDDTETGSVKYFDGMPIRSRNNVYHSGVCGSQALHCMANARSFTTVGTPNLIPLMPYNNLHKPHSYLSLRFVLCGLFGHICG